MRDWFIIRWARHNPGLLIALVLSMALVGCAFIPFHAPSPTDGKTPITRAQLNAEIIDFQARIQGEVERFSARARAADEELSTKEMLATAGLQEVTKLMAETGFPIPAAATGLLTLLVGGLAYDNRRKDTKLLLAQASKPAAASSEKGK